MNVTITPQETEVSITESNIQMALNLNTKLVSISGNSTSVSSAVGEELEYLPILQYRFNEAIGSTTFETSVGLSALGTLKTTPSFSAGNISNCLTFANSQGIEVPATSLSNTNLDLIGKAGTTYTVCLWIKSSKSANPTKRIVEKSLSVYPFVIRENTGNGVIVLATYDGATLNHNPQCSELTVTSDGLWHHCCWVIVRSSTITLYRDGVYNREVADTTVGDINNAAGFDWGNVTGFTFGRAFVGSIDDFRVYALGLPLTEITKIINSKTEYIKRDSITGVTIE